MKKQDSKFYDSYTEDFVTSSNQDCEVKDNYKWLNNNIFYKIISSILYFLAYLISLIYCRLILCVSFKNKKVLKGYKGYYLFSNHTQMIGDALDPLLLTFPKKNYVVVSSANLGIPFLGKILPFVGALPIPKKIHEKEALFDAMHTLVQNHSITIYPFLQSVWHKQLHGLSFLFSCTSHRSAYLCSKECGWHIATYTNRKADYTFSLYPVL